MFSSEEISNVISNKTFLSDFNWVQESLVKRKAKQGVLFDKSVLERLEYLVDAIVASCIRWESSQVYTLCKIAAEISEALSYNTDFSEFRQKRFRLAAALLYEHAGLPALSQAAILPSDFSSFVVDFFKRTNAFRGLGRYTENNLLAESGLAGDFDGISAATFAEDALNLMRFVHGSNSDPLNLSDEAIKLSKIFELSLNSGDFNLFNSVLKQRKRFATISNVNEGLFEDLKIINFPTELWGAQVEAVHGGLLDEEVDSFGLASPTGTGKTFLTRLLIVNVFKNSPSSKILYIVPSRALVYEVSNSLQKALEDVNVSVMAVNPQLVMLDENGNSEYESSDVVVLTPEKADLLIRLGQTTISSLTHIIVDEAHHIESDTRGVLLELYLWRLKKLVTDHVKFIFLSAVAPNIGDLTKWTGSNPKSQIVTRRATRMRAGVYRIRKSSTSNKKEGWIEYSDKIQLRVVTDSVAAGKRAMLVQLAGAIFDTGPILIVAKGKKECETLAEEMIAYLSKNGKLRLLTDAELDGPLFGRLDCRLEREMYHGVPMRKFIRNRVAYHHAGLPPRVRTALEDAIRGGLIDFVFATTTLAEGVNFPFSSVIIQALVLREAPEKGVAAKFRLITPRIFWNIAGRAGRPGFDKEGQVILFEPSLGLEKVNAVIDHYLNPDLQSIPPVISALSKSIIELRNGISTGNITNELLRSIELGERIPKKLRGTINLLRVGLVHAKAADILDSTEDILESSFARLSLTQADLAFGNTFLKEQETVVNNFFKGTLASYEKIVAEMGLSLDTIERLKNHVLGMDDERLSGLDRLFFGGELNLKIVSGIVYPIAEAIAELEGARLGGFVSEVIEKWLSGIPLVNIKSGLRSRLRNDSLEDLISVIYSRIQFLLPWGLFATDSIVTQEARRRGISYNSSLRKLSYLTDSGVPSFDAHRLVNLEFERVDATRLYREYRRIGGQNTGADIVGWLLNLKPESIRTVLRGIDNRRLDFDLESLLNSLRDLPREE